MAAASEYDADHLGLQLGDVDGEPLSGSVSGFFIQGVCAGEGRCGLDGRGRGVRHGQPCHQTVESQVSGEAKFALASATNWSSIPEAQGGGFDLAVCIFVMCALLSKEEVKEALAEIFKMLKPGGKLILFESHVLHYTAADDKATFPLRHVWITPKEDGTRWSYFEDEGKPQEVRAKMNSGREIKLTD